MQHHLLFTRTIAGPFASAARRRSSASCDSGMPQLFFVLSYGTEPNWMECVWTVGCVYAGMLYASTPNAPRFCTASANTRLTAPSASTTAPATDALS